MKLTNQGFIYNVCYANQAVLCKMESVSLRLLYYKGMFSLKTLLKKKNNNKNNFGKRCYLPKCVCLEGKSVKQQNLNFGQ